MILSRREKKLLDTILMDFATAVQLASISTHYITEAVIVAKDKAAESIQKGILLSNSDDE